MLWDLNPVLLTLGPLEIRWYGLVYALGFLLAYYVLQESLGRKKAESYVFWLVIGSILGARLFYAVVYDPLHFLAQPGLALQVWRGGLSMHGGIIGAALVTWWFCRKHGTRFYQLADVLVLPLAFVVTFGRLANYANGELWGTITHVPWCVEFPGANGCRHPSQLYEALYTYGIFVILYCTQQWKQLREGTLFWMFVTFYGLFRFVVTFLRAPDIQDPLLGGLPLGQWLSLLTLVIGVAGWILLYRNAPKQKKRKNA